MHHRASRLHAVVAALLLTLGLVLGLVSGLVCSAASAASLSSSSSDPSAVVDARAQRGAAAGQEALAPRSGAVTVAKLRPHAPGLHVDVVAALVVLVAGLLLLIGWIVAGRGAVLARLVAAPLGARAPPALV